MTANNNRITYKMTIGHDCNVEEDTIYVHVHPPLPDNLIDQLTSLIEAVDRETFVINRGDEDYFIIEATCRRHRGVWDGGGGIVIIIDPLDLPHELEPVINSRKRGRRRGDYRERNAGAGACQRCCRHVEAVVGSF